MCLIEDVTGTVEPTTAQAHAHGCCNQGVDGVSCLHNGKGMVENGEGGKGESPGFCCGTKPRAAILFSYSLSLPPVCDHRQTGDKGLGGLVALHRGGVGIDDAQNALALHINTGNGGDAAVGFGCGDGGIAQGDNAEVGGGFRNTRAGAGGGSGGHGIGHIGVDHADGTGGESSDAAVEDKGRGCKSKHGYGCFHGMTNVLELKESEVLPLSNG